MSLLPAEVATVEPGGAEWLAESRRRAADRLRALDAPDDEQEVWRYSPIGRLDLTTFVTPDERSAGPAPLDTGADAARLELTDGRVTGVGTSAAAAAAGLTVKFGRDEPEPPYQLTPSDEYVSTLALALTSDPVYIDVAPGAVIDGPVVIHHDLATPNSLVATHLVVRAGADCEITIIERRQSGLDPGVVVPLLDLEVQDAARVRYVDAQLLGPATWQLGQQRARVGSQATLAMYQAGLGGDYARMRTDCELVGRGATGNLAAVYLGGGHQTLDYRTFQDHVAPDTTSDLLFKGAVDDESRSIYSGLIRVRPDARGTAAFQTNRNIKLADTAWAESVPNLEIENNDVRCSHASTVGPIDEDQLFYLESRGVPPGEAERLILAGFFDEVLSALPAPALAEELAGIIARRLDEASS